MISTTDTVYAMLPQRKGNRLMLAIVSLCDIRAIFSFGFLLVECDSLVTSSETVSQW